jgi:hypothetical protein
MLLSLLSCRNEKAQIEGFDSALWQTDRNGCNGQRVSLTDALLNHKDNVLGLDEMEVVALFGKPDENELYKRNQKFYYYYIDPATSCGKPFDGPVRKLVVRFNAVGLVKEVLVEQV